MNLHPRYVLHSINSNPHHLIACNRCINTLSVHDALKNGRHGFRPFRADSFSRRNACHLSTLDAPCQKCIYMQTSIAHHLLKKWKNISLTFVFYTLPIHSQTVFILLLLNSIALFIKHCRLVFGVFHAV